MTDHHRTPYLEQRAGTYYFRRRLPFDPNSKSNRFFVFSLRTDIPSEARDISARLTAMTTLAYDYVRGCPTMDQNTFKALLSELVRFEIAAFEKARLASGPRSLAAAEFAAKREDAIQTTLRQAIYLRDWEAIRAPLDQVAKLLGVTLPDTPLTYATLALEALRVSIDVSRERQRRDRGEYDGRSEIFTHVMHEGLGNSHSVRAPESAAAPISSAFAVTTHETIQQVREPVIQAAEPIQTAVCVPSKNERPTTLKEETSMKNMTVKDDIRDVLRSKNLLNACSENSISLLEKGDEITLSEAFDVYVDFKSHGCTDDWDRKQKPDRVVGQKWRKSSLSNLKTGKTLWSDLLQNKRISEIREDEIDQAVVDIREVPKLHGKSAATSATHGFLALVELTNQKEIREMDGAERSLRRRGCTNEEEIRDARLSKLIPRLRIETYVRHVRCAKRIGTMLHALGITPKNIFVDCAFTNDELSRLKATEDKLAREKWDDRWYDFLNTPVFQGKANGEDDPLFWMPVLARCLGLRSEEAAQLGPDDISSDMGIPYLRVRQQTGDSVKSEAAFRKIPIHAALLELGFMELVKLAQDSGHKRLLPKMTRGKNKQNFTENFTKAFGHYRKTNKVYWHGLDFHALRTTFHHDLMEASTPGYIKRNLMGHNPLDEGEKSYAQNGIPITTLFEHVSKVPFEAHLVISPILSKGPDRTRSKAESLGLKVVSA